MTAYAAMLRGVNVSGHNKISMRDLEALFVGLGHSRVTTYIQSGNVVFNSDVTSGSDVARALEEQIAQDLGLHVAVLVRTSAELAEIVANNPFVGKEAQSSALYVTLLAGAPDAALVRQLDAPDSGPDQFHIGDRAIYLRCPSGYGRTKLNNTFWERRLRVRATTRNWKTASKLLELASALA